MDFETYEDYVEYLVKEQTKGIKNITTNKDGKTIYHYAIVMIANKGTGTRPKKIFAMLKADAMKLCNDKRTSWTNSMAIWADLVNFTNGIQEDKLKTKGALKDNGSMDTVIEELGLTKIEVDEWKELFKPFNIDIK